MTSSLCNVNYNHPCACRYIPEPAPSVTPTSSGCRLDRAQQRTQYQISHLDQSSKPSQLRICSTILGFTIPPSLLRLFCNTHQLRHHNGHWRTSHNLMRLTPYSPIPARLHGLPWFCKALFRHVVIGCIPSPPD